MKKTLGIDFGGTYIKGALIDERGQILVKEQISTLPERGHLDILMRIADFSRRLAELGQVEFGDLAGVGLGIPGFLDDQAGVAMEVINVGWKNVAVRKPLEQALNLPVFMENDANAAALGEAWIGAGKDSHSVICVTLGTGVGGGVILSDKVWRGVSHMGGEIGHFVMEPDGAPCNCGRKGCLETFSSATGIIRMVKEGLLSGKASLLSMESVSTAGVFDAARAGDDLAQSVIAKAADYLGRGLAMAADLVNPEVIIIGGGVARAGEELLNPVRKAFFQYALPRVSEVVRIVPAVLGNDAGVVGAGRLTFQSKIS